MVYLVRTQLNARVDLLATVAVRMLGAYVALSRNEWLWISVVIVLVWSAEAFNTALETRADTVHPEQHPGIGRAKDVAAGPVLILAPHLAGLFG